MTIHPLIEIEPRAAETELDIRRLTGAKRLGRLQVPAEMAAGLNSSLLLRALQEKINRLKQGFLAGLG